MSTVRAYRTRSGRTVRGYQRGGSLGFIKHAGPKVIHAFTFGSGERRARRAEIDKLTRDLNQVRAMRARRPRRSGRIDVPPKVMTASFNLERRITQELRAIHAGHPVRAGGKRRR